MELIRTKGAIFKRDCWKNGLTLCYEQGEFVYRHKGNIEGRPSSTMLEMSDFIRVDKNTEELKVKNINYIGKDYVLVTLQGRNTFHKAAIDLDLKEGDLVVVEFSYGFELCKIKHLCSAMIDKLKESTNGKSWVVDKVNLEAHELRKSNTEKKDLILKELCRRREEASELSLFEALAKTDSIAAELLVSFKKLIY